MGGGCLTEEDIRRLQKIARNETIADLQADGADVCVDDFAGGNVDDAHERGTFDGETDLARDILTKLGRGW